MQVPSAGGIPYFERPPGEEEQKEDTPPGLQGLLCVVESPQCSAEVRERTLGVLATLYDNKRAAHTLNMTLWMLVRTMVGTARCVRALNHLINAPEEVCKTTETCFSSPWRCHC
eukprot:5324989-Pyramimonas_sp.AAC.2